MFLVCLALLQKRVFLAFYHQNLILFKVRVNMIYFLKYMDEITLLQKMDSLSQTVFAQGPPKKIGGLLDVNELA